MHLPPGVDLVHGTAPAPAPGVRDPLRTLELRGLTAVHDIARVFAGRLGKPVEELHKQYPPQVHPLVRTHPETGEQALYVNTAFTSHVEGLSAKESDRLLAHLYAQAAIPEYQCRFRWEPGSIAFWDNRAAQHYAASDYFPAVRRMERVTWGNSGLRCFGRFG